MTQRFLKEKMGKQIPKDFIVKELENFIDSPYSLSKKLESNSNDYAAS